MQKIIFIHCILFAKFDLDILKYKKDLLFMQSHDCAYFQQIYTQWLYFVFFYTDQIWF